MILYKWDELSNECVNGQSLKGINVLSIAQRIPGPFDILFFTCTAMGMSLISLFSFRHILFDFSFKKRQCIIIFIDMYES